MKLSCKIGGKDALIVGYAQGRKSKVMAVVICEGELRAVRLRDVQLQDVPEGLEKKATVVAIGNARGVVR